MHVRVIISVLLMIAIIVLGLLLLSATRGVRDQMATILQSDITAIESGVEPKGVLEAARIWNGHLNTLSVTLSHDVIDRFGLLLTRAEAFYARKDYDNYYACLRELLAQLDEITIHDLPKLKNII